MKTLRQAVVFAILMENDGGILTKAPTYIMEKLKATDWDMPEGLLDSSNMQKFCEYKERWGSFDLEE